MSPFKSKQQAKFLFSQHPKIAKEFAKKTTSIKVLPKYADDFDDLPSKMRIEGKAEVASLFVKKVWNAEKNKFDYVYPEDIEKKNRKIALDTMKASESGEVPKKFRLEGPAHTISKHEHNKFITKQLEKGKNVEKEHTKNPDIAKKIAIDHLKEGSNYYQLLDKMEKELKNPIKVETQDSGNSLEVSDGAPGRNWEWTEHKYADRAGSPGHYRYDYSQKEKIPDEEEKAKRNIQEQKEKVMIPGKGIQKKPEMIKPKLSGELQNPHTKESRQSAGFEARSPGQKLPPLGMGLHQQNESAKNSLNQNLEHAKIAMKGTEANTMADQAKQQGNIYSNKEIGIDNMQKQMSIANPYSKISSEQMNMSHQHAATMAAKSGGTRYTVSRSKAGLFSICVYPDNTVYDPSLGVQGVPLDVYLGLVPFSFVPS